MRVNLQHPTLIQLTPQAREDLNENQSMAIPQSFLQDLLSRVDIVDVVGRYVQLKKGGANFMGLCPFHGEKSPSFSVSPNKQFFHCFGCGKNGNAIGFLMDHAGMSFVEAVKDLAQEVGMVVPEDDRTPEDRQRAAQVREQQQSLSDVLAQAATAYQKALKQSPEAIAYLKQRGLTGEVAKRFGLGYAPPGWRHLASVFPDYQDTKLVQCGLVIGDEESSDTESAKRYDRFRDRVMFPIRNVKGETIGFGGRVMGQGEPKYLNSPETPVFHKGRELYGLFEARTDIRLSGHALVTEGYMDVVALAQMEIGQAVATLGTACTPDHVRLLFRFTDTIVFSFDGDGAGRRAARKAMEAALPFATDTRTLKFLFLPSEHDPDSFVRAHGKAAFEQAIQEAMPLSKFLLEVTTQGLDMDSAEGRAQCLAAAQPLWQSLPDGALKRQLLAQWSDLVGLGSHEVLDLWKVRGHSAATQHKPHSPSQSSQARDHAAHTTRPGNTTHFQRSQRPVRNRTRAAVPGRADVVVRLLVQRPDAWGTLSSADQHMLADWPAPHGEFFAWLEGQWHEHGPQAWAVLDVALQGQPFESWLKRLLQSSEVANDDGSDWGQEMQEVLKRMHIERLMELQAQAIADAEHDPKALERWRQLGAQLKQLQTSV